MMSRVCDMMGKRTMYGNNVSHSNKRTRRVFYPNLQWYNVTINNTVVRMRLCRKAIRTLEKSIS